MLNLQLPEGAEQFDAAVFTQTGEFVRVGHREACEQAAQAIEGLYCWIVNGRAVIRGDFEGRKADDFLESADSRETSPELMDAILYVADRDTAVAERIWADPTRDEVLAIWERVTRNGKDDAAEFCWGAEGDRWAVSFGIGSLWMVEQLTSHQWEPMPSGQFRTEEAAQDALESLVNDGFDEDCLRVVKYEGDRAAVYASGL